MIQEVKRNYNERIGKYGRFKIKQNTISIKEIQSLFFLKNVNNFIRNNRAQ